MPTAQQKQSEFVERAMELSFEYAKAISRADFFSGRVLNSRFLTPAYDAKDALFTHLESHAQQQDAVVGALVEALTWREQFEPREGEDSNERFERIAEVFHRETGFLRPGKDCVINSCEHRQAIWDAWMESGRERCRAALALVKEVK